MMNVERTPIILSGSVFSTSPRESVKDIMQIPDSKAREILKALEAHHEHELASYLDRQLRVKKVKPMPNYFA